MNMAKFSKLTGLSAHTLRYYEKIGLLRNIQRNSKGHRVHTDKDLQWVSFIIRLKETAMPLEQILEYASLREAGTQTMLNRQKILEAHRQTLKKHIDIQLSHLSALEHKIQLYKDPKAP